MRKNFSLEKLLFVVFPSVPFQAAVSTLIGEHVDLVAGFGSWLELLIHAVQVDKI